MSLKTFSKLAYTSLKKVQVEMLGYFFNSLWSDECLKDYLLKLDGSLLTTTFSVVAQL